MSDLSVRFDEFESDDIFSSSNIEKKTDFEGKRKDKMSKAVKIIFLVLSACILIEFVFYKFILPSTVSPVVSVSGQKSYSAEEIVDLLRPLNIKNWFDFDVDKAVSVIASESGIDSVSVKKTFPNRIYVNIEEREPVAMTFVNFENKSIAVQIDEDGVMFPQKKFNSDLNLPIISGLPIEHMTEGMRIPLKYRALIDQVSIIKNMPQKYFSAISEICVVPKEYGNYELVLIPSKSKIRVLTDRTLNEDALKYMMVVLDVVNSIEPDVSEIDLRYGSVSYRKK